MKSFKHAEVTGNGARSAVGLEELRVLAHHQRDRAVLGAFAVQCELSMELRERLLGLLTGFAGGEPLAARPGAVCQLPDDLAANESPFVNRGHGSLGTLSGASSTAPQCWKSSAA